ncbi:MAG: DUF177 domain-containing protein, partial [Acidimicrobiia bacterium]
MSQTASPFLFAVSDLLGRVGSRRSEAVETSVDYRLELSGTAPDRPFRLEVLLESASGGINVTGDAWAVLRHRCHRCLTEWEESVRLPVAGLFARAADPGEYALEGDIVDLESLVRD